MRLRLATGLAAAAVVVGGVWVGAPWLTLLALVGGGLAIHEVYRLTPPGMGPMPTVLGIIAVVALLLASEAAAGPHFHLATGLTLAAWAFAAVIWFVACYGVEHDEDEDGVEEDEFPDDYESPQDDEFRVGDEDVPGIAERYYGLTEAPDDFHEYMVEGDEVRADGDEDLWEDVDEHYEGRRGLIKRPWLGFLFLLLAPVYVGFLLGHGLSLRDLGGDEGNLGRSWLLFTLLVVFACDTGAYAVGRLVGRHRMAPRLSPNKTWEGAAGGFAASVGAALLVGVVFELEAPFWQQALIGAVASVAAQVGDLAESALKRAANVKDSGSIMPGHGGILDRMDSILFALPAVYYLLLAVGFRL